MDNELQALLALMSLLAAEEWSICFLFIPARACPVLENGHVIRVFSRFNVDGDQF